MTLAQRLSDPARVLAIDELGLRDAEQQPVFARLNELAQRLLGVPVSVVSMITEGRQMSISQAGLSDDHTSPMQLPLSHTLCQHVVESGEALVVPDADAHPLTRGGFGVRDLGMGSYAGVPLTLAGGETIGAFCAIDTAPRQWTPDELATIASLRDIAVELLDQRRRLATSELRDPITGLARRALFVEQVRDLLAAVEPHERIVLAAVDLDDFRGLNRRYGHAAGDALLATVALSLEQTLTRSRRPGAVARIAADVFVVAGIGTASEPADRLRHDLLAALHSTPAQVGMDAVALSARGATLVLEHGVAIETVLDAAAAAVSRSSGSDERRAAAERIDLVRGALPGAIERDELALHLQPIYDLETGQPRSVEALLRWTHPDLGAVGPDEFIPLAEETGLIVPIGEWVLRTALAELRRLRSERPGSGLTMSVNVAPEQLLAPSFAQKVADALAATHLPADALVVEITERTLAEDQRAARDTLDRLAGMGVHISIDDFGTGFSTLSRLAEYEIDEVKLDRSFIADLIACPRQHTLVASIIAMAAELGACVVAEGIETVEQYEELRRMGCGRGQGYLMARPRPGAELEIATFAASARPSA